MNGTAIMSFLRGIRRAAAVVAGLSVLLAGLASIACDSTECTRSRDCPTGEFCQSGACVPVDSSGDDAARDDGGDADVPDAPDDSPPPDDDVGVDIDFGPDGSCDPTACRDACRTAGYATGICAGTDCFCGDDPDAGDADADGDADDGETGDGDGDVLLPECTVDTAAVDCDDANVCTNDACDPVTRRCYHYGVFDGTGCGDGTFCNGAEECQDGVCAAPSPLCTGRTGCLVESCNETADRCDSAVASDGTPCDSPTGGFCDGAFTCQFGFCSYGGPACTEPDPPNPCATYTCDEATDTCTLVPRNEGGVCAGTPSGCGAYSICAAGACVPLASPCDDRNPCTSETCTVSGGSPTCARGAVGPDGPASDDGLGCTGTGQTCRAGVCPPVASRPCTDGNLCTVEPCAEGTPPTCGTSTSRVIPTVACSSSAALYGGSASFVAYEYFTYGASCAGTFYGPESAYTLTLTASRHVIVRLTGGGTGTRLLLLNDGCSATTCRALDVAGTLDAGTLPAGTYTIVGDTTGARPSGASITVDCL
jgi:hypothetical protein